ncbi:MAG: adenylate/guanylate cyclase domain-containing protein, partial [Flavobacteriales bacterium]|nr:adenylate/guanylate cyclase domain-containing protein [Flavobacteriales bacterium]
RKFAYDLWGDTVNLASRLESHGVPMRVQCSENFAQALGAEFKLETRGEVALKGAGTHTTYFLEKAEPVAT